ncbi:predicted protein [Sparassis crispa]|uniref:Uncharacterized protein n=1 Tax=Sparassis crispa TaxID=139825 RepID=A0A401GBH6_9APHY|nr:predicted protein [Sparassis crispa]GBE79483.1 predicted protein [Sparassis crispa]
MDFESSDILGGDLSISHDVSLGAWSLARASLAGFILLPAAFLLLHIFAGLYRWRDSTQKKATRRRHGIPDYDHRPFPIALGAALRAREQDTAARSREKEKDETSVPQSHPVQPNLPQLGQRVSHLADTHFSPAPPNNIVAPVIAIRGEVGPATGYSGVPENAGQDVAANIPPTPLANDLNHPKGDPPRVHRKHAREEEGPTRSGHKRSRTEGGSSSDDEKLSAARESEKEMDVDEEIAPPKRGFKRTASHVVDEGHQRSGGRDKRARKAPRDKEPQEYLVDEEMRDDEATSRNQRGKKRVRVEMGEEGSVVEDDEDEERGRRRRKRRAMAHKKPDPVRGQKRAREAEALDSDEEEPKRDSRKKRGKKGHVAYDLPVGELSQDPLCKGRHVGEEWEVNGMHYKVGANGQRLRREVVKQSRSRFHMPSDSHHPDRATHIDVFVETWLSEDDYKAAKDRQELAWQDSPKVVSEPATPGDVPHTPNDGKGLLWSSMMSQDDSPSPVPPREPFMQSIATNVGLHLNPFQPDALSRRVSSVHQIDPEPSAVESPKIHSSRSYSKWEKQNLEAAAMEQMRVKQLQVARASVDTGKATAALTMSASSLAPAAAIPSITLTPPGDKPSQPDQQKTPAPLSFGGPSIGASTDTHMSVPKLTIPESTPASSITSDTIKAPTSGSPAAPTTTSSTAQNKFTFTPSTPSLGTQFFGQSGSGATPLPSSTSSVPNFFGAKGASTSAPTSSITAPASNLFGTTKPPAAGQASAPAKFSFNFAPSSAAQTGASSTPHGQEDSKQSEQSEQSKVPASNSLISRLGLTPASTASQTPSTTTAATGFFTGITPTFGPPAVLGSNASADVGQTSGSPFADAGAATTNAAPSSSTPSPPKFSFGFTSKPTSTTPTPASTAALAAEAPKPAFSFNFAAPVPSAQPATPSASSGSSSAFGAFGGSAKPFGAPADSSTSGMSGAAPAKPIFNFGSSSSTAFSSGTTQLADSNKPKFSFGNAGASSSSTPSAFGNTASTSSPAATNTTGPSTAPTAAGAGEAETKPKFSFNFGSTASTSAFGAPSFGNQATAPALGTQPTTSNTNAAPSAFGATSFGNNSAATPSAFGASSLTNNATTAPAFGTQPSTDNAAVPAPSAFGNPSQTPTPSAFGFTNPPQASTPSAFGFTNPPQASTPSAFGFTNPPQAATPSAFGFTNPPQAATPSAFGFTNPPQAATPSAFGSSNPPQTSTPSALGSSNPPQASTPSAFGLSNPPSDARVSAFGSSSNAEEKK